MYRVLLTSMIGLMLSLSGGASALTFKSDGSVVQKSGKVEVESFANRFREEMSKPSNQWAKSTGSPRQFKGYFGDDALIKFFERSEGIARQRISKTFLIPTIFISVFIAAHLHGDMNH